MPEQPRKTPQMPAGTSSLSERIAALQRKASDSSPSPSSMRRTPSGSTSPGSDVHSHNGSSSYPFAGASSSSASSSAARSQAQAVKDRIARFQLSADEKGEKPLLPRSSFGAPGPNPDNSGRVARPYPGAMSTGGGSGNWGEGVLRPQMTGGAWLGTGASGPRGSSTGSTPGLMPQLTGPTWTRRQGEHQEECRDQSRLRADDALAPARSLNT